MKAIYEERNNNNNRNVFFFFLIVIVNRIRQRKYVIMSILASARQQMNGVFRLTFRPHFLKLYYHHFFFFLFYLFLHIFWRGKHQSLLVLDTVKKKKLILSFNYTARRYQQRNIIILTSNYTALT